VLSTSFEKDFEKKFGTPSSPPYVFGATYATKNNKIMVTKIIVFFLKKKKIKKKNTNKKGKTLGVVGHPIFTKGVAQATPNG
jgi:hypothetical protein